MPPNPFTVLTERRTANATAAAAGTAETPDARRNPASEEDLIPHGRSKIASV